MNFLLTILKAAKIEVSPEGNSKYPMKNFKRKSEARSCSEFKNVGM